MTQLKYTVYEQAAADDFPYPSDIKCHLPVLYEAAKKSHKIIELGVRSGYSSAAFLAGLPSDGWLWSCDLIPRYGYAEELENEPNWTFTLGHDLDPSVFDTAPDEVDILFIDTSHFYVETIQELPLWSQKVAVGGCIMCHDTQLEWPQSQPEPAVRFPVMTAITKFIEDEPPEKWAFSEVVEHNGLGTLVRQF